VKSKQSRCFRRAISLYEGWHGRMSDRQAIRGLLLMSLVLVCLSVVCVDHNLTEDTFDITDTVFRHGNNWEDAKKPAKGVVRYADTWKWGVA